MLLLGLHLRRHNEQIVRLRLRHARSPPVTQKRLRLLRMIPMLLKQEKLAKNLGTAHHEHVRVLTLAYYVDI